MATEQRTVEAIERGEAWPVAALAAADYVGMTTPYTWHVQAEDHGIQYRRRDGSPEYHYNCSWWEDELLPADLRALLSRLRTERREQGCREKLAVVESRRIQVRTGRVGQNLMFPTIDQLQQGDRRQETLTETIRRRIRETWPDMVSA